MVLADLVINIFASIIYSVGLGKFQQIRFWAFKKREQKWICDFCKENDGSILLSNEFEKFLTYHNPVAEIFSFVLDSQKTHLTENEFLNQIVDMFKTIYNVELSVMDQRIIVDFFSNLLSHLKTYLKKLLGFKDKFLLYLNTQYFNKLDETAAKRHDEIVKKLESATNNSKISDEKAKKLYDTINDSLLSGQINMVRALVPVIENRNDDLENGIKISLQLLSEYHLLTKGVLETY